MLRSAVLVGILVAVPIGLVALFTDWQSGPVKPDVFLTVGANLILVGLTGFYVYLTYALLQSQVAACVVVHAKREGQLVYIVIENIGRGLARDIRFKASEAMKFTPACLAVCTGASLEPMSTGPLATGIPALAPGQKRVVLWAPLYLLQGWLGDRNLVVTCTFTDGKAVRSVECPLEVHSLSFTGEEYTRSGRDLNEVVADMIGRSSVLGP